MFKLELDREIISDVMKNANKVKDSKEDFASLSDRRNKQLYYLLTEEQLKLVLKNDEVKNV